MSGKREPFGREQTLEVKGLAILLMMAYHLLVFQARIPKELRTLFVSESTEYFIYNHVNSFGQICVPLFLFLSGFGLYRSYEHTGRTDVVRRLKNLYLRYWKVLAVCLPIGFFCLGDQAIPLNVFAAARWDMLVEDIMGLTCNYNAEWWFMFRYVCVLLMFPFWASFVRRHDHTWNILLPVGYMLLTQYVIRDTSVSCWKQLSGSWLWRNVVLDSQYNYTFFLGAALAKDGLLERCRDAIRDAGLRRKIIGPLLCLAGMFAVLHLRDNVTDELDGLYCALLCVFFVDFVEAMPGFVAKLFQLFGRYSMTIWLTHTFLCYYYGPTQRIVYAPRYDVLVCVWFWALSLAAAVALEKGWALLEKAWKRAEALFSAKRRGQ